MTTFRQYLSILATRPPLPTEDILTLVLPLFRATLELHTLGLVAPLDGLTGVIIDDGRLGIAAHDQQAPQVNWPAVDSIEAVLDSAISVVEPAAELIHSNNSEEIERPVFATQFRAWEQCVGHHDAPTDVFLLGLLLGSVSLAIDLADEQALRRFAAARHNLFQLRPDLHPVIARAIRLMAEPHRRRRSSDLAALITSLEHYRDGRLELEFELDRIEGFHAKDLQTKEQIILSKLQQRLFDASRRNRLLHFRATGGTINLTLASTPLSEDVSKIPAERILIWNDDFQNRFVTGTPLRLNNVLNFDEAIYCRPVLERIRAESRRDMTEYGFAQLRLAACFLSWTNLKEQPPERFDSPLVLVPVELTKEKGVEDSYLLRASSDEAEVNPALRRVFRQLFNIDLPETIDLSVASLTSLYDFLGEHVKQSQPAVDVELVEQPIIEDLRRQAKKRLQQYQRRAGMDDANGLETSETPEAAQPTVDETNTAADKIDTSESSAPKPEPRYQLREAHADNPYIWTFELCRVTLANFRYHKMSLVRDYDALIGQQRMSEAFDEVFRLAPRSAATAASHALRLEERYDVLTADPTQAAAVARARSRETYIIQGPPGTGKSQTISNLIADYAARQKRVLFVCEKRAAIDVVYSRLSQRGMADLCCLIHDSQADKKAFVQELKRTYEQMLADSPIKSRRDRSTQNLSSAIAPLVEIERVLQTTIGGHNLTIRKLLIRLVQLQDQLNHVPANLVTRATYDHWLRAEDVLAKLEQTIRDVQPDGVFARHPLRLLLANSSINRELAKRISEIAHQGQSAIDLLSRTFQMAEAPSDVLTSAPTSTRLVGFLEKLVALGANHVGLLDAAAAQHGDLERLRSQLSEAQQAVEKAREHTIHWHTKLPADETRAALQWLEKLETDLFRWFKPRWWQLRRAILRGYDFSKHAIQPSWRQVLQNLVDEHEAVGVQQRQENELAKRFGVSGPFDQWYQRLTHLRDEVGGWQDATGRWLKQYLAKAAPQQITEMISAAAAYRAAVVAARGTLDDLDQYAIADLQNELPRLEHSMAGLPAFEACLHALAHLPPELAELIRRNPLTLAQAEAATALQSLHSIYREYPDLRRWDSDRQQEAVAGVDRSYQKWLETNCLTVRGIVRDHFVERAQLSSAPAGQLSEQQKQWKKSYAQGRRDLEREFGKTMRYRSIRDLISGSSGEVIRDMKPIWLMSPLSVADSLPLDPQQFDVVIFDEASQITLQEAIPTLCRAPQAIIVGDEMQLPPTSFFAQRDEDDLEVQWKEEGVKQAYDLTSESLLNHAARHLPSTMLGWHYRSRNELLIAFSNAAFYGRRLLTVPEEELVSISRPALRITQATQANDNAGEALRRPISFHRINGIYEKRRNTAEAEYIAHLLRALFEKETDFTFGIIAFSEAQQSEIEDALWNLASQDSAFRDRLDAEYERMEENQFVGLLVKNLENIQGDERDVIILSVCYGPDPDGKMRMHFGPINVAGGEKRLNVAFSRAKQHMIIVGSFDGESITNDYNSGARCLKNYLRYASAVSTGAEAAVKTILAELTPLVRARDAAADTSEFAPASQLAAALREHGWLVDQHVGQSHFQCDLAVRGPDDTSYRLAILFDHEMLPPHSDSAQTDERSIVLERRVLRPQLLENFGWHVEHVLLRQWRDEPQKVVERILAALR